MAGKKHNKQHSKGFAAFYITILILAIVFGLSISISVLIYGQQKISQNVIKGNQSYYAAEAGIEDMLLRLKNSMNWSSPYTLRVGASTTTVQVSDVIGGVRTILSQASSQDRVRKIRVDYVITNDSIAFHYGAQVGDGGMEMGNNSRVLGNVFSNGSVIAPSGKGYIDNDIIVARNGNKIKGLEVGGDATAHTCENSNIGGDLTYVSGGSLQNCTASGTVQSQPNEVNPADMPISSQLITSWKAAATAGGIITNNVVYDGTAGSLGPVQIGTAANPRNLTVVNNAWLKITGTIYVTGNVNFSNNAIIEIDQAYESLGGMLIADGSVITSNNVVLRGTGEPGSYILIISTNNSTDPLNPAISVNNNAGGAIFYTTQGLIYLGNNMTAREITGYKIKINNNAQVQYESGLQNALFSNGPGGSWKIQNWKEVE